MDTVNSLKERRIFPRVSLTVPIEISPGLMGETSDLSETGLRFVSEKPFLLSKAQAKIELSPKIPLNIEFKVIWNKHLTGSQSTHEQLGKK